MTVVTLERTGGRFAVRAEGHAAPSGAACAAVSALMQSLETWLRVSGAEIAEDVMEPGHAALTFSGAGCETAFALVRCGFLRLAAAVPAAVRIEESAGPGA